VLSPSLDLSHTFAKLVIPIEEIMHVDKRMTAYVIPNAIQISTSLAKYTFASLLSRDTTYDVIYNIWRSVRPEGSIPSSPRGSLDGVGHTASVGSVVEGMLPMVSDKLTIGSNKPREATMCACGREGKHYSETAMETILPGEPEKIYNLMFASGFIKDFMRNDEKLIGACYRVPCVL
jgi:GRAM domain